MVGSKWLVASLISATITVAAGITSAPASAQEVDRRKALTAPPTVYTELVACKDVADPTARLACYDEKVTTLQTAQSSNQVVIADREQVREARRGLFGLTLPRIKLFDGEGDEGEQIESIEGIIKSARTIRSGKWLIQLEEGAVWQQTEPPRSTMRRPKAGDSITIERAALGSYLAKVNEGRGFKVKRVTN
ncbi:hypothetical protein [Parasphingorhabdus flavimaris]|jgi:hypothetical protein|uniref:Uncharacterized protein n=1 Tax=Parasphingorhabdus flavimaris TaxID=266812 RepID=A0ABX2MYJ7_9SPHN|nr:hypothetical protein [Parasphingorhabdus flavimaris]NVD26520.1 hypothetical protein [Parasphingorhabdus flavimaris]|tara:strand:- start:240 stop:812 length:573 start_codon:yes stop_codon:yes gene_type:complete